MSFDAEVGALGRLEWFDPAAFEGDAEFAQDVCDFVLALALAYNDLHDIFLARILIGEVAPDDGKTPSKRAALTNGLTISLIRAQTGVIHELLSLISRSGHVLEGAASKRVLAQLSRQARECWAALSDASRQSASTDPMAKALLFYRNKVAFHYDAKEIRRGYQLRFGGTSTNDPRPLLSRGEALQSRRFHFADAAAEAYLLSHGSDPDVDVFLRGGGELIENVERSLYEIVTRFIAGRGFGWRELRA